MARSDKPGRGHNSGTVYDAKERAKLIKNACERITTLTAEKKALGDEISSIKNELVKGKLGMKVADFNAALRLYNLEGDDRDAMLATVHETFDALGLGGQLDWVEVSQRAKAKTSDSDEGEKEALDDAA
jgi:uncharacterized protein (UPF0335 family)